MNRRELVEGAVDELRVRFVLLDLLELGHALFVFDARRL